MRFTKGQKVIYKGAITSDPTCNLPTIGEVVTIREYYEGHGWIVEEYANGVLGGTQWFYDAELGEAPAIVQHIVPSGKLSLLAYVVALLFLIAIIAIAL